MQVEEELLLIKRAQKGDLDAYEKLISDYEKTIYNLCLRMLKDSEEAYDAAQEVCLKIWRQISTFKGEAKFSTWVYRLASNQCLDMLRKNKKRQNEVSLYLSHDENEEKIHDEMCVWEDMSDKVIQEELNAVLNEAISELKEDYRLVIVLRDVQEKSYDEIASILSLSLGTVKSRISRARQALKKILHQDKEPYRSFFRQKH